MDRNAEDGAAKAVALANGLRKSIAASGRRWTQWPGGANDLATVIACIDVIRQRLQQTPAEEGAAHAAAAIADLRTILEWTSYQTAAVAMARAVFVARKTKAFAERFGLLEIPAAALSALADSETSLIENVQVKNGYMLELSERHPHLELPRPLVGAQSLAPQLERKMGKLDLIAQLTKSSRNRLR